jgi:hypothetical protein
MPYFIQKREDRYCVVKGTKEEPGETKKCYPDRKEALKYLAALYANVEDAQKDMLTTYKAQSEEGEWQDRWIAVSTDEIWDAQGEMFTKEAMDYDISQAQETGEYPELRLFHVRGLKLGQCDSMKRVGEYAVDQGYWNDTPFAQAVKELVQNNPGKWKISRGFHMVEAAGLCPQCGVGLSVRPLNLIVGAQCPACGTWVAPSKVKSLRHLKTRTFDITLTDVPAVSTTGVATYSVLVQDKDGGIHMDRSELKERLLKAGLEVEVVEDFLGSMADEDLLRMKDQTPDEIIEKLQAAIQEIDDDEAEVELKEDAEDDPVDESVDVASLLKDMEDRVVQRLADQMSALEITVETPDLAEIVGQLTELREAYTALEATFKEIQGTWDEVLKTDTERLHTQLKDMSPAQRIRLRATLTDDEAVARVKEALADRETTMPDETKAKEDPFHQVHAPKGSVVIRTVDGREFSPSDGFNISSQ